MSIIDKNLIQDLGILSDLVYQDKYFDSSWLNESIKNSEIKDKEENDYPTTLINTYKIKETRDYGNGFQAMLVENNGEYTFVFRGSELGEFISDWGIADGNMIAGEIPEQMTSSLLFVKEMIDELSLTSANTNFTGFSLRVVS